MIVFRRPAFVIAAHDHHLLPLIATLRDIRSVCQDAPVVIVPRNGPLTATRAAAEAYGAVVLSDCFSHLDYLARCWFGRRQEDRARRLVVFDVEAPAVFCIEPGTAIVSDPSKLFGPSKSSTLYAQRCASEERPSKRGTTFIGGDPNWSAAEFVLAGPPVTSRVIERLAQQYVPCNGERLSILHDIADDVEGPLLNIALSAADVQVQLDVADWPFRSGSGPSLSLVHERRYWRAMPLKAGSALAVVSMVTALDNVSRLDNGGAYTRCVPTVVGAPEWLERSRLLKEREGPVLPPPALLSRVSMATVVDRGIVIVPERVVLEESMINCAGNVSASIKEFLHVDPTERPGPQRRLLYQESECRVYNDGTYAILKQTWDNNYGHWLIESLPRLALVSDAYDLAKLKFVVASDTGKMAEIYRESLHLLGVDQDRIIAVPDEPLLFRDLIYPAPMTEQPWVKAPRAVRYMEVLAGSVPTSHDSPKKIFVSRNGQPHRRLTNEEEVFALFAKAGYVMVEPERLSLSGQIALFREATHVAGNLGAALTNVVFSPPGVRLLALTTESMQDDFFWDLVSHKCGSYTSLHGVAAVTPSDMYSDFSIEIGRLSDLLLAFE